MACLANEPNWTEAASTLCVGGCVDEPHRILLVYLSAHEIFQRGDFCLEVQKH